MTQPGTNPVQELSEAWAILYPLLHWTVTHPFSSLLLFFLGLYLIWLGLRGLIYLTETLWLKILRSPVWLLQALTARRSFPLPVLKKSELS
ncbi:MAG: hypothetical protein AAGB01_05515, partial [Cyanobacteria bacterium P01_F01_bin.42]